jgi:hypothetical protein
MTKKKEAAPQQRAGHWLKCPVCAGDRFWQREAQLNTKVMTLIDLDWVNPSGDCYICEQCRHIMWFYREGERP